MKIKKFSKKLTLNKETVADLNLKNVRGGTVAIYTKGLEEIPTPCVWCNTIASFFLPNCCPENPIEKS